MANTTNETRIGRLLTLAAKCDELAWRGATEGEREAASARVTELLREVAALRRAK